ncbi:MAG: long-chain-fatty-acid--CoA ligase [Acidimicrobiaceae bacterium]|nr:long-chain-fatty-acid--CoA ligase [Acidimicrobiaceae bacterium]
MPDSIAQIVRTQALRRPTRIAISGEGRSITYAELDARSSQLANALRRLGVNRGDRVAYIDRNATEFWETAFAAAKLGAVITPLNFRLSDAEVATIMLDAEPSAVVIADSVLNELGPAWRPAPITTLVVGDHAELASPNEFSYEEALGAEEARDPGGSASGSELAVLMYSSGTTGAPKGIQITADNLLFAVANFTHEFGPDESSSNLVSPPYYHIAASGWSLIAMNAGGRIVQVREPLPRTLLSLMVQERTTHAALVPAIIRIILEMPDAWEADFSSLHTVVYGSSPIDPALLARAVELFDAEFTQSYGLTETVGIGTLLRPKDHVSADPTKLKSAGRAATDVEVDIVEVETGHSAPVGQVGEIVIRGPQVTPGYWRRPDETAALFLDGGWLRTGDAGRIDAEGYVYIVDRIKDIIVSGGENVAPAEVEAALMGHAGVLEAAVVGVPSEKWGETPKAFVVLRPGSNVTVEELIEFCREHLAHYKCPTSVEFIESLPRNPSGKVLRRELRGRFWAEHERSVS